MERPKVKLIFLRLPPNICRNKPIAHLPCFPTMMTNQEFDLLDELYFVQSFRALQQILNWPDQVIGPLLFELARKGWVKVLRTQDEEIPLDEADFEENYTKYYYLATKAGLLAHNSR